MKKLSVSALAFAAALVASAAAHADTTPGWYVGAGVGGTFGQDPIVHTNAGGGKFSARDEDVNLDVLANAGYAYSNGWRVEGEYFHNQINVNNIDGRAAAGGHVSNNALFANVLYDFAPHGRWTPYVGAGIGPDFVNVKSVGAAGVGYLRGDTLVMGYQGIAGVSTQLDDNWAVTADYRYISSFDPKVDSTAGGQGRMENASHNVIVGVRYSFGAPAAAPVAEPVAPMHHAMAPMMAPRHPAHTAVAGSGQNFMVFFDWNKSVITPEAKRIIASAADEFKRAVFASIQVTGHTDTSGKATYNQKLSERRAAAVEAELAKLGVSTENIKEMGVGENGLMVPTADGVREAQNRRAEIVLSK
ncbi:MAG: OmpA family protein [Alphaproteobacteria bacterium]|nr:OmpA family protein [Alphaproteobacteria bacterium]